MKNYKIIILGIVIVIVAAVLIKGPASNADNDTLKIGVISSLTGDYAAVGENMVKGIRVAEMVYEAKTGKNIDLVVEDDQGDGVKGLSAYGKLSSSDKVDGLINFFTTTMDTIYTPTKTADYPVMMLAFQANNVADDHVFQMTPGNDDVWPKYAQYVKGSGYDLSNVVLAYTNEPAQQSFVKAFAAAYGDKTTMFITSANKSDLRVDATKIAALKPTAIIFFMTPENGAVLTKELLSVSSAPVQLIYDVQLVTGVSLYEKILGDLSKIEGAVTLSPEGDPNPEFIAAYKKLYPNEEPGFIADFGYDTFNVYMENYDKDNSKWIAKLRNVNTKGASGHIKFDKNGIRLPDLVIKKVIGGELKTTERLPF